MACHHLHRLGAIGRDQNVHPEARQDGLRHIAIDRIVLGQQHATAGERENPVGVGGRLRLREARLRQGGVRQPQPHLEGRTLAGRAVKTDVAAHQGNQFAGDRQAQAGTAKLPRGRAVGLRERLEQPCLHLWRHPDPAVGHRDHEAPGRIVRSPGLKPHTDLAGGGELDRIANQVGDHLPQAQGVAHDRRRQLVSHRKMQPQSLRLGTRFEQRDRLADRIRRVESDLLQVELAGLDFREIQNVVDDAEQRTRRYVRGLGEPALGLVERRGAQQFEHAQHPVHRRADFVTHVGQKLRLRPIGLLGDHACLLKRLVGRLVAGDIEDGAGHPHGHTGRITLHHPADGFDPQPLARPGAQALLDLVSSATTVEQFADLLPQRIHFLGVGDVAQRGNAGQGAAGGAEQGTKVLVDMPTVAWHMPIPQRDVGRIECEIKTLLGACQRNLGRALRSHIDHQGDDLDNRALLVQ